MKKYIGTKEVSATPAYRVGSMIYPKDGAVPRVTNREDGYKVVYEDGYESWSPKDVFEKAYKPADTYLDRMKIEFSELENKYQRLSAFLDSDKFKCLTSEKRNLLAKQYDAMQSYYLVLRQRISLEQEE